MVTEYFFNFSCLFVWKNGKNNFSNYEKYFSKQNNFFQPGKIFFPIFPGAKLQKNNEISNQDNILGLRKDRKQFEKLFSKQQENSFYSCSLKAVPEVIPGQNWPQNFFQNLLNLFTRDQNIVSKKTRLFPVNIYSRKQRNRCNQTVPTKISQEYPRPML